MASDLWMLLLSASLILGGAALLIRQSQARQRSVAQRVSLVAQAAPAAADDAAKPRDGFFIADTRAGNRRDLELLVFARICRRLGLDVGDGVRALTFTRLAMALAGGGAVLLTLLLGLPKVSAPAVALGGVFVGWMVPVLWLRRLLADRTRAVTHGFADALELLVVCAEAGLALDDALARVTKELQVSQPALAEELAMTAADMRVLPDRNQAFAKLAERIDVPTIRNVVSTLSQTLRYGTPLANALRVAAAELRSDSIMDMEERAGRLPALMSVPLMIFILPTILLIVSGPAILRVLDIMAGG